MGSLERPLTGEEQLSAATSHLVTEVEVANYSDLEKLRAAQEIALIEARLTAGEYLRSSFRPRSIMNTTERTAELFEDLSFYSSMGLLWQRLLFGKLSLDAAPVAELGCGPVPKVALGLHYLGFTGVCHLVDPDPRSLELSQKFLAMMGSTYGVSLLSCPLCELLPGDYQAVFANHLIDDLILNELCERESCDAAELYEDEAKYLLAWRRILSNRPMIDEVIEHFTRTLLSRLRPGGIAILVDYPSFSHRALGLRDVIECVTGCQQLVRGTATEYGGEVLTEFLTAPINLGRISIEAENVVALRRRKEV